MGLDIVAYRKLHEVDPSEVELDEYGDIVDYETYVRFGTLATLHEEYWPGRSEPYNQNIDAIYEFEEEAGMRAGSYSGYNMWRSYLDEFSQYLSAEFDEAGAFRELIMFSDCEGLIGSVVSQRLYDDFTSFREDAQNYADRMISDDEQREWFLGKYDEWTRMFEFGLDDGAVRFC